MYSTYCKSNFQRIAFSVITAYDLFFTPIPCTYTSFPLDGMARNYIIILIYMDTQDYTIHCDWIHFIPTSLYLRREKTFGLSWNRIQVLLLNKQPLRQLDHGSSSLLCPTVLMSFLSGLGGRVELVMKRVTILQFH